MKDLLPYIQAFGTPVAAFIASCVAAMVALKIGHMQADIASAQASTARDAALTARNKLRMDMYDKRLVIYTAVMHLFSTLATSARIPPEEENDFAVGIHGARWMFGTKMEKFLEEKLWFAIVDYNAAHANYKNGADSDRRAVLAETKAKARENLLGMQDRAVELFAEHMEFERDPLEKLLGRA